jgi:phosphoribosylformimino-5-aminoimidazole carboxamide ribotide isomerase
MEIIPVLDIMGGRAVAGKSGKREEYTEQETVFASSSDPVEIAKNLPFERLYAADLDGIMNGTPDIKTLERLARIKRLMVDIGIKESKDIKKIQNIDCDIIIGTETLKDVETVKEVKNPIVSMDIKDGRVISGFLPENPVEAFKALEKEGVTRFIILDISAVGTMKGADGGLDEILKIRGSSKIIVGGGLVKEDLEKLKIKGVSGALVGTALHRGFLA